MKAYRKLIVAIIGVGVMLTAKYTGIDAAVLEPQLVDGAITALTLLGIWRVENEG